MKQLVIALALGSAAIATAASAQDEPAPRRGGRAMGMMRADTNGDGTITRAEYQAQVDQRFARMDANGNGRIDDAEVPRRRTGRPGGAPDMPPPPGAGPAPNAVGQTRDQFRAAAMTRFARLDANGNGRIDATEMAAMHPGRFGGTGGPPPPGADR